MLTPATYKAAGEMQAGEVGVQKKSRNKVTGFRVLGSGCRAEQGFGADQAASIKE